jgi:putative glutamine amidotransferase
MAGLFRIFITILLVVAAAPAFAVELFLWKASPRLMPIVIAAKDSEAPEQAVNRYFSELKKNPELVKLFRQGLPELQASEFVSLASIPYANRALLLANTGSDLYVGDRRMGRFREAFGRTQMSPFLLPMVPDLGLTSEESAELNAKIIDEFPLLVVMGGDDVEPSLYGEQNRFARNLTPKRDEFEIRLIRDYAKAAKGFIFGVCRGAQLTAAALGYKLVQDIPREVGAKVAHGNNLHLISLLETDRGLFKRFIADLATTVNGITRLMVNSFHHQAIKYIEGGPLELAAVSDDGVTEALEFSSGHGLLSQFHPEYMENAVGQRLIGGVATMANEIVERQCRALFGH